MERGNVETVNPDSTLHARSRCAPSLSVMIPPLTLVQEPPWPNRFHSSFLLTRGRMRRDCVCGAISIGRHRRLLTSQIPPSLSLLFIRHKRPSLPS